MWMNACVCVDFEELNVFECKARVCDVSLCEDQNQILPCVVQNFLVDSWQRILSARCL